MPKLTRQQHARARALAGELARVSEGAIAGEGNEGELTDEGLALVELALADVVEQAERAGLDALSPARRVLLGLCELDIGASTEGLAFTLINGWNLIPAMRTALTELKLPGPLDVLDRACAMIPPDLLTPDTSDENAEAWLEAMSEEDREAFDDLGEELLDAQPPAGYAGLALIWIARHPADFS
jgi:hypothetical protein